MNKSILIVIISVLVIALAGFFVYQNTSSNQKQQNLADMGDTMMDEISDDHMITDENSNVRDSSMMQDSKYVEFTSSVLKENVDKRRVLFFYANWCPICGPADANFKENTNRIPDDVVLIRVNYNDSETDADEMALADQYGITYQHTFVQIDESGNTIATWNGGQIEELLANIE
jgi:thiol:disulfide interchange protein